MEKIFFVDKPEDITSVDVIEKILAEYFDVHNAKINRTENGKPYLENIDRRLFFSVTHTKKLLFIAFSDENVGIDSELLDREVHYENVLRRFLSEEREEINSTQTFLCHWTIKESAIKWLGGTIARDLEKISYVKGLLKYKQLELPIRVTTKIFEGHILSICSERDFSDAPFIHYTIQTK